MPNYHTGSKYAHRVISEVSSHLLQCHCIRHLLPHLVHKKVVNDEVSARILSKSDSKAAESLVEELNGIASEPGSDYVIEHLYLALLNCYEKSQNVWCRTVAISRLQPAGKAVGRVYISTFIFTCSDGRVEAVECQSLW